MRISSLSSLPRRSRSSRAPSRSYNRGMTGARDTAWVVEQARAAGFSLCGVARAEDFPELERLPEWLARGYAGQMSYLADPRRSAVASLLEGARSLIVCALLYNTARPHTAEMAVPYASSNVYRQEEGVRMSADAAMAGGAPATGTKARAVGYHAMPGETTITAFW